MILCFPRIFIQSKDPSTSFKFGFSLNKAAEKEKFKRWKKEKQKQMESWKYVISFASSQINSYHRTLSIKVFIIFRLLIFLLYFVALFSSFLFFTTVTVCFIDGKALILIIYYQKSLQIKTRSRKHSFIIWWLHVSIIAFSLNLIASACLLDGCRRHPVCAEGLYHCHINMQTCYCPQEGGCLNVTVSTLVGGKWLFSAGWMKMKSESACKALVFVQSYWQKRAEPSFSCCCREFV